MTNSCQKPTKFSFMSYSETITDHLASFTFTFCCCTCENKRKYIDLTWSWLFVKTFNLGSVDVTSSLYKNQSGCDGCM